MTQFGGIPDPRVTARRLAARRRRRRGDDAEEPPDLPPGTVVAREPGRELPGDAELASRIGVSVYDSEHAGT